MRRYWGTLAGLVLGIPGGVFAALFGAFLGFLVDLVWVELRVHRASAAYLETGRAPSWLPRAVPLCGALYGRLARQAPVAAGDAVSHVADHLRRFYPDRFSRRPVERMLLAAMDAGWTSRDAWIARARASLSQDEARAVFLALWAGLQWSGSAARACGEAQELARAVGIPREWIDEHLSAQELLDAQACAVLGVSRQAKPDEIKRAYRLLVASFHPDTTEGLSRRERAASEEAFKKIQAAYEKLRIQRDF